MVIGLLLWCSQPIKHDAVNLFGRFCLSESKSFSSDIRPKSYQLYLGETGSDALSLSFGERT